MKLRCHLAKGTFLVRCLGPGQEHSFLSTDPRRNRVCEKCKQLIRLDARLVVVHDGREDR